MDFTPAEQQRYARHLALPEIGTAGQARLRAGRVLVIGAGGLGSPAALYLAAAGVGTLGLMDGDAVELSNLQRQILHATPDLGRRKVDSAAARLRALNPATALRLFPERFTAANAAARLADFDFAVDATDTFAAKFLIADACHAAGRPYAHAGVVRYQGQVMTVLPGQTACYRCVFEQAPPETGAPPQGPLGVVPGVLGALQAAEAIKFLLGIGRLLTDRLLTFDALTSRFREVPVKRNPQCRLCGVPGHARA